jgi:uncharacterized protein
MPEHRPSQERQHDRPSDQPNGHLGDHPDALPAEARPNAAVVLDTNVVLEWFWFADARVAAVAGAVEAGTLHWVATAPMRAELDRVLARLPPWRHGAIPAQVLASFDRWVSLVDVAPAAYTLRCADADDQPFIDLAVHAGARWLFSRDRAVLKLARRAAAFGCTIATPDRLLKA